MRPILRTCNTLQQKKLSLSEERGIKSYDGPDEQQRQAGHWRRCE